MERTSSLRRTTLAGKRVLLAEDDPFTRALVARILRAMLLEVIEASDGGRMLVAVTSQYKHGHTPKDLDLIVTDLHLPVVDGLGIVRAVRGARWTTPIILTTADDSAEVRDAAAHLGVTVIPKPLDLDVLEAAVVRMLAAPPPSSRRSLGVDVSAV